MQIITIKIAICFIFYIIGAYATTDILRLLKGSSTQVNTPDCYCPICGRKIALKDQLPIFSYIKNHGRCVNCKSKIPISDLFLEIFLFVSLSAIAILLGFSWMAFLACLLIYEGTKVTFICIYGHREKAYAKNLFKSLANNVVIFLLLALLFLLIQIC